MNLSESPEIIALKPFIYHATELQKVNPKFAYYMKSFAIQKAHEAYKKLRDQGKDVSILSKTLSSWLTEVEDMKRRLGNDLNDKEADKSEIVDFILKLFFKSDNEERDGTFTKQTIKNFQVVARFIEMLGFFGPIPPDLNEKRLYAKAKAVEINKLFKNPEALQKRLADIQIQKEKELNEEQFDIIENPNPENDQIQNKVDQYQSQMQPKMSQIQTNNQNNPLYQQSQFQVRPSQNQQVSQQSQMNFPQNDNNNQQKSYFQMPQNSQFQNVTPGFESKMPQNQQQNSSIQSQFQQQQPQVYNQNINMASKFQAQFQTPQSTFQQQNDKVQQSVQQQNYQQQQNIIQQQNQQKKIHNPAVLAQKKEQSKKILNQVLQDLNHKNQQQAIVGLENVLEILNSIC